MFHAILNFCSEISDDEQNSKLRLIRIVNLEDETDKIFKEEFENKFPYQESARDQEHKVCIDIIPEIVFNKRI